MDLNTTDRPILSNTPQLWQNNDAQTPPRPVSLLAPSSDASFGDISSPEALQRILMQTSLPHYTDNGSDSQNERVSESLSMSKSNMNVICIPRRIVDEFCPNAFNSLSNRHQKSAGRVPKGVINLVNAYPLPPSSKKLYCMQFVQKNPALQGLEETERTVIIERQWQALPQTEKMKYQRQAHAYLLEFRKKHKNHRDIEEAHEVLARATRTQSSTAPTLNGARKGGIEPEKGVTLNKRGRKAAPRKRVTTKSVVSRASSPSDEDEPPRQKRKKNSNDANDASDDKFSLSESYEAPRRGKKRGRSAIKGKKGDGRTSAGRKKAKAASASDDDSVTADSFSRVVSIPILTSDPSHQLNDVYVRNLWAAAFSLNAAASLYLHGVNSEIRKDPERRDYGQNEMLEIEMNYDEERVETETSRSRNEHGGGEVQGESEDQSVPGNVVDAMDVA